MNKTTIKQALMLFNISRSSLYNHMKKQGITPMKEKGRVHLLDKQIIDLKRVIHTSCPRVDNKDNQDKPVQINENIYKNQIKELREELKQEREENKKVVLQLGQWQGRAKTLEEQNQKLLTLQAPPKPAKIGFFQKIFGKK